MRLAGATIIACFISFCPAWAQGGEVIVNPNVINISAKEYGGGNKNWDIAQDSRGIVYIANNDGLLEYDGTRWTLHCEAECGLIRSVAVDGSDRIFTGGFEEFGCWERDETGVLHYRLLSNLLPAGVFVDEDIWKIHVVERGVYFQSFAKVYFWDGESVEVFDPGGFILFMQRVGDDFLIHSGQQILRLDGEGFSHFAPAGYRGTALSTIRVILPTGDPDAVMLGTATQGIYILKEGVLSRWGAQIDGIIPSYDLNCALKLENGDYLFGTILNGIYRTDPDGNVINHFSVASDLPNNTVLSLFSDGGGTIWAGLDKGLARLDYSTDFNFFIDHSGTIGSVYTSALHRGMLYIGSNKGLFCIPWKEFSAYGPLHKVRMIEGSQGQVWSLKVVEGDLLCGHNMGLMVVADGNAKFVYQGNGIFDMTAVGGGRDDRTRVVASTYTRPMVFDRSEAGEWRLVSSLQGFSAPGRFIEVDHMDNIWIAHMTRNVYRLRTDEKMTKIVSESVYDEERSLLAGPVKMGRMGGRIVFIAGDRFFLYNDIDDGIIPYRRIDSLDVKTREINRMVSSGDSYHWLIGKNSATLLHYTPPGAEVVKQYNFSSFDVSTVDGFENLSALNDTLSLVCLDNGFLLHNMNAVSKKGMPDRIPILKSVGIYDEQGRVDTLKIVPERIPRIPHKKHNLFFQFAYPDPGGRHLTLMYRVDDISGGWTVMSENSDVRLERMPRGSYTLRVRAVDLFGQPSPEHTYRFKVLPAWYSSAMAIVCYVLAGMALFLVLWINERIRLRKRHIRRLQQMEKQYLVQQNKRLLDRVAERETELLDVTGAMINRNKILSKIRSEFDDYEKRVPASRFPRQLYDRVSKLMDVDINPESDWKLFMMHFEQNYGDFFNNVKARFPNLTAGDLKLCACLKMNLSTKDIASLLCISVRGVEIGRYRLRKKMGLDNAVNLNEFFINKF